MVFWALTQPTLFQCLLPNTQRPELDLCLEELVFRKPGVTPTGRWSSNEAASCWEHQNASMASLGNSSLPISAQAKSHMKSQTAGQMSCCRTSVVIETRPQDRPYHLGFESRQVDGPKSNRAARLECCRHKLRAFVKFHLEGALIPKCTGLSYRPPAPAEPKASKAWFHRAHSCSPTGSLRNLLLQVYVQAAPAQPVGQLSSVQHNIQGSTDLLVG